MKQLRETKVEWTGRSSEKFQLTSDQLGMYHLVIAPEVGKDIEAWVDFYKYYSERQHLSQGQWIISRPTVVLDNGAFEGELWTPKAIDMIAFLLAEFADVIVCLPDALGMGNETAKLSRHAIQEYLALHSERIPYKFAYITQGHSMESVLESAYDFVSFYPAVDYLMVPRLLVKALGSRQEVVSALIDSYNKPIHLLGFSDDIEDDLSTLVNYRCVGIDSAEPIWVGDITSGDYDLRGGRPKDYFQWTMLPEHATKNIQEVRGRIHRKAGPIWTAATAAREDSSG